MDASDLVLVKVIRTPRGEAPEHIREQWIGAKFAAFPSSSPYGEVGLETHLPTSPRKHFLVEAKSAIAELRRMRRDEAADYFQRLACRPGLHFTFGAEEVKVLGTE